MSNPSNGFSGSPATTLVDKPPAPSPIYDPFAGKVFEARSLVYWTNPTNLIWTQSLPVSIRATILRKHEKRINPAFSHTSVDQSQRIAETKDSEVDEWYDIMLFNGATKYYINGKDLSWRPVSEGLENEH
ncbi:hypothetical protein BOTCAL_0397g00010 [Botryotinia calthae]|uniref:Uncharacterized protein n=1 Tax=Botryotinia calthae TaxID=38488 RepID=A0A4Y8CQL7_9HELO|nr:hypothetical protein BOTCAL_0397g00010 [Botryotinia calthae]